MIETSEEKMVASPTVGVGENRNRKGSDFTLSVERVPRQFIVQDSVTLVTVYVKYYRPIRT